MYYADTTNLIFSNSQVGTGMSLSTGVVSTNVIDLQSTPTLRDLSIRPMFVRLICTEAFTAAGDGGSEFTSLLVEVKTDSTANLATSATVIGSKTIALAALTLGAEFVIALAPGQIAERYLGMWYTSTAELPTAGKLTAILVPSIDSRQYFADGSSIVAG